MSQQLDSRKNILFVICGPSGSGKGTFMDYAATNFADQLMHIPTYTTRAMASEKCSPINILPILPWKKNL